MNACKYPKMQKKRKRVQPAQPPTPQKCQMNCTTGNLLLPTPPRMFSSDVFDAEMALADSGDLLGNSPDFGFGGVWP